MDNVESLTIKPNLVGLTKLAEKMHRFQQVYPQPENLKLLNRESVNKMKSQTAQRLLGSIFDDIDRLLYYTDGTSFDDARVELAKQINAQMVTIPPRVINGYRKGKVVYRLKTKSHVFEY